MKKREMRLYQRARRERMTPTKKRRSYLSEAEDARILVALAGAVLSEGQAARLLDVDRVELRRRVDDCNLFALAAWDQCRARNPVSRENHNAQ